MRALLTATVVVVFLALLIGGIAWTGAKGSSREGKKALKEENDQLRRRLKGYEAASIQAEKTLSALMGLAMDARETDAVLSQQVVLEIQAHYRRTYTEGVGE